MAFHHYAESVRIRLIKPNDLFRLSLLRAPGACGQSVDEVCAEMYESNQPSNYYNRFY